MEIKFENIVLRDMVESDIEDYVRWFTTETAWSDFDAPWEPVSGDADEERKIWMEYYECVKNLPEEVERWKFEIEHHGHHVGWVTSYMIDENYEWVGKAKEGQTVYRTVGIDLCESDSWGKGVGTNALQSFVNYLFSKDADAIYTQTWSGNTRMIRLAEKLGFTECSRYVDKREVNGKKYDALTFRLKK